MSRKRPSGAGSKSQRLVKESGPDGDELLVPQVKDAATAIFVANEDGTWPAKPVTVLLTDAAWIQEGATFTLEEMRPGRGMGSKITAQVIDVRVHISIWPGKYGQIKRFILAHPMPSPEEMGAVSP